MLRNPGLRLRGRKASPSRFVRAFIWGDGKMFWVDWSSFCPCLRLCRGSTSTESTHCVRASRFLNAGLSVYEPTKVALGSDVVWCITFLSKDSAILNSFKTGMGLARTECPQASHRSLLVAGVAMQMVYIPPFLIVISLHSHAELQSGMITHAFSQPVFRV